jgi:hypothetical protein
VQQKFRSRGGNFMSFSDVNGQVCGCGFGGKFRLQQVVAADRC